MPASEVDRVVRIATCCAFDKRLPARSVALVDAFSALTSRQKRQVRAHMRQIELPQRMARRATEIAHFNPQGAICIINAMMRIFKRQAVINCLQQQEYAERQIARAVQHRKHGNLATATLLFRHVLDVFGDEEASVLAEEHRLSLAPHQETRPPSRLRLDFASVH